MKDKNFIETPLLTERFEQAFVYAIQLHAHQLRKGGQATVGRSRLETVLCQSNRGIVVLCRLY